MPPRKKPKADRKTDRHKPARQYRVPLHLAELLDKVADREYTTPQYLVIQGLRKLLREKGELPPPEPPAHPPEK